MKKITHPNTLYRRNSFVGTTVAVLLSLVCSSAQAISLSDVFSSATSGESVTVSKKPLPVHQAFSVVPEQKNQTLTIHVDVKDGYYAYQNKLKLELPEGVTAAPLQFSASPTFIDDPDFGRVPVFEQSFSATTTLTTSKDIDGQPAVVKWQGCAKAGLCYPPEKTKFTLTQLSASTAQINPKKTPDNVTATTKSSKTTITSAPVALPTTTKSSVMVASQNQVIETTSASQQASMQRVDSVIPNASTTMTSSTASQQSQSVTRVTTPNSTASSTANATVTLDTGALTTLEQNAKQPSSSEDIFGLTKHTGLALLLLFLAGLGLAFTPCVLPMLPIVANIVARQHNPNAKNGFLLTGSYGLGVATSYGIFGAVIAIFGQSIGIMNWLQNPVILLIFAALFVLLGLYMLDVVSIRLPQALSQRLQKLGHIGESRLGSISGSYLTGFFSALIVSPCVSAPLAGALAGVAMVGNPLLGFVALFLLGLGLSTPLILLGATQGNFMPKAGEWMNWVKTGFGLMLFAVALLMVERVFLSSLMLVLWAVWFAVVAVWLWRWQGRGQLLTKAIAILVTIWAACLIVGAATGNQDSWQPLNNLKKPQLVSQQATNDAKTNNKALRITKLSQLAPIVAKYPNVLVDVTAQWCIECRIMDKNLFENPPDKLSTWQVVKLDVTDDTPDSREVYQKLKVFGPPVLLYFQHGKLVQRQNGEVKRDEFEKVLAGL